MFQPFEPDSPVSRGTLPTCKQALTWAADQLAQLVEHRTAVREVAGSNQTMSNMSKNLQSRARLLYTNSVQLIRVFSLAWLTKYTVFTFPFPDRLQNSRFRKAGSAVSVILECERLSLFSLAVFSLAPAFRSNMVRRSRSQKIRLFCSLVPWLRLTLMGLALSVLFHRFQIMTDLFSRDWS